MQIDDSKFEVKQGDVIPFQMEHFIECSMSLTRF